MPLPRSVVPIALLLAACQTPLPPVDSSIEASPELTTTNPADVAVLPIEDLTSSHVAAPVLDALRQQLVRSLFLHRYSPLSVSHVDSVLAENGLRGRVMDAAWLESVGGRFGEDALLSVRLTRWDTSSLMADGVVRFTADANLTRPGTNKVLWGGTVRGAVKAGGTGPAPRERQAREASAAKELAKAILAELPPRSI